MIDAPARHVLRTDVAAVKLLDMAEKQ